MDAKHLTCLYADDHATFRALMGHYMGVLGHELCLAKDGDEAFAQSLIKPYDLIFLDQEMPHMNGIDVAYYYRHHQKQRGQKPAPIILVTGRDHDFCALQIKNGLIDFYLPKPFLVQDLILIIDHALSQDNRPLVKTKRL